MHYRYCCQRTARCKGESYIFHILPIFLSFLQPSHPGKMVQIGWNAGPRHAHVFGLTKSFTKNLDDATKTDHDHDAIAAANIAWAVAKAWLPTDITNTIENCLLESGLPRIATRHVAEGIFRFFCIPRVSSANSMQEPDFISSYKVKSTPSLNVSEHLPKPILQGTILST